MEYCSGNGQWILEKAKNNPEINWIAVEKRFDRARRIWVKRHNMGISNLLVVFGDARLLTKYYLPKNSISEVFINFPDPWPKKKHAKNRLVTPGFMEMLSGVVKQQGVVTMVTDDALAKDCMVDAAFFSKSWKHEFPEPYYLTEMPGYGGSYFDALWREKNREIKYLQFKNLRMDNKNRGRGIRTPDLLVPNQPR